MDKERLPPAGLRIAGDFPIPNRYVRRAPRCACDAKGRKNCTDNIRTLAVPGFQIEVIWRWSDQRVVEHFLGLEYCASSGASLQHTHTIPCACVEIGHLLRTLAEAHHDGRRPSPPEAELMHPCSERRPRKRLVHREVLAHSRSRPAIDLHHLAGSMPLLNSLYASSKAIRYSGSSSRAIK